MTTKQTNQIKIASFLTSQTIHRMDAMRCTKDRDDLSDTLYTLQKYCLNPYFTYINYSSPTGCLFGSFESLELLEYENKSFGFSGASYEGDKIIKSEAFDNLNDYIMEIQELLTEDEDEDEENYEYEDEDGVAHIEGDDDVEDYLAEIQGWTTND